jgi:glycosyltransferase involved in cell wall biosynthesis
MPERAIVGAVRFYWYWPFARPEELDLAAATVRPGESVTVQVVDRTGAPEAGNVGAVEVLRDLPDVDRSDLSTARWLTSRAGTYWARERLRRRTWRSGQFDLVHLHYLNRFTDWVSPLPRPLVLSVHDVVPHEPRLGQPIERRLLLRLYHRPDAVVVHHGNLAEALQTDFRVPPERIHVVPHQVFPVPEAPVDPPPGPPTLLVFGALRPNKGISVLREMMRGLDADLVLHIAGHGDAHVEDEVRSMASEDERVRCEVGFVSLARKRELFRAASLVVLPYTGFASQSGVLHDAYGHGRPVVVTDVGALGHTVREDGTGIVVPPNDPSAMAEAVVALLAPAVWRPYAEAAERVASERSPAAVGARLRRVYDLVLG